MIYTAKYASPIGELMLAGDGNNITGLWIIGQKYYALTLAPEAKENQELSLFKTAYAWLNDYFKDKKPVISDLPIAPAGSVFRQAVWKSLCDIPYGTTTTYGAVATLIATKIHTNVSARAVGGAVGHNPISIIIPCHRVIGASGSLTGYAGGIDKKIELLKLENTDVSRLIPKKMRGY